MDIIGSTLHVNRTNAFSIASLMSDPGLMDGYGYGYCGGGYGVGSGHPGQMAAAHHPHPAGQHGGHAAGAVGSSAALEYYYSNWGQGGVAGHYNAGLKGMEGRFNFHCGNNCSNNCFTDLMCCGYSTVYD